MAADPNQSHAPGRNPGTPAFKDTSAHGRPVAGRRKGGGPQLRPMFPRWANYLLPLLLVGGMGAAVYLPTVVALGFSPQATDVGYAPQQPIPYSHALHVGQLGMDCRYCHTTVADAAFAAVPPTQTCLNCHAAIKKDSNKLKPLWESWNNGTPIQWTKIHDLPDYSYFNHSTHVNKGVSCVSCHGRIDQMEVVHQAHGLNMAWCLDCHREPEKYLRPADQVTNLGWTVAELDKTNPELAAEVRAKTGANEITQDVLGPFLKAKYAIKGEEYMQACSTCHR